MDQRIYINPTRPLHQPQRISQKKVEPKVPFRDLLQDKVRSQDQASDIQFSKHAEKRLASRNIQLDHQGIQRLSQAVDQAAAKGSKESLVLMDNVAYVVSVKNRMVITAVDDQSMQDNVFTNIDSAVIAK